MKIFDELKWRGLINDISSPDLEEKLNNEKMTFYIGTDPTADSLHIGHYSSFLIAKRLKLAGHNPILLVGGATGLIGDPKPNTERPMITHEELDHNYKGLRAQVEKIFGFEVVNNYDWSKDINFIDYLRDYGKYFSINYMLAKETVKARLETGITYTEFSYMIMQSLDFLYLYEHNNCILQLGGQDQWGNIISGVELIRKKIGKTAYALTMPHILDENGRKIGKSEGNAVWLDKNRTSSYELYQYFINTSDIVVIDFLKKLTFLTKEEIEEIEKSHIEKPELHYAQQQLAKSVITDLHGDRSYDEALRISEILFSGEVNKLNAKEIKEVFKDLPVFILKEEKNIIDVLVESEVCTSKREAREFINCGTISINGEKTKDLEYIISKAKAIDNEFIIIRRGKKKYYLLKF